MKDANIKWQIMEGYNFYVNKGLPKDRALLTAIVEVLQMPDELLKGDKG